MDYFQLRCFVSVEKLPTDDLAIGSLEDGRGAKALLQNGQGLTSSGHGSIIRFNVFA
jgi:hypothetical protein